MSNAPTSDQGDTRDPRPMMRQRDGKISCPGPWRLRKWLALAGLVVAIKSAFLLLDHQPLFLLGDSATYLVTALEKAIPPDRSFSYGFFVRRVALKSSSLESLLLAQTLGGVFACLSLAFILTRWFQVAWPLACLAALLCSMEPLQLVFERFVMTESVTLVALLLTLLAALSYLDRPRLRTLFGFHLAGIALISLRLGDLPFLAGAAVLVPWMAWSHTGRAAAPTRGSAPAVWWRRHALWAHLAFSLLCLVTLHGTYRHLNGYLSGKPPAYLYEDGFFKLAAWAPILEPGDAWDPSTEALLATLKEPGQRKLSQRLVHRWGEEGLVARLRELHGDPQEANQVANRIAHRAAQRAPGQLLVLAWSTYWGYWTASIEDDAVLQRTPLPDDLVSWLGQRFQYDASSLRQRLTLSQRYFQLAHPWFFLILLSPFLGIIAVLLVPAEQRRPALLVCWAAISLLASFCLFSTGWSFRHLHQNGWLTLLILSLLCRNPTLRYGRASGFIRRLVAR